MAEMDDSLGRGMRGWRRTLELGMFRLGYGGDG